MKRIVILLAAVAVVAGCGGQQKKAAQGSQDSAESTKVPVKVAVAQIEEVEQSAVFTSNIEAFVSNNIVSNSQGARIEKILVDVGSMVREGQLLATMDPSTYNATAIQEATAKADYERMKKVYEAGGISKSVMDQTESSLVALEATLKSVREATELRSPISGVVTARNFDAGDFPVMQPIFTVMQIDRLKVALNISEQYFPRVHKGMDAEITADMYPDRVFAGKVSLIYPAVDPATRTFTVEITIPNPKGELRPGMFSRTHLVFGTTKGIMVEDIAIQRQMGTNDKYVFLDIDGKAERRLVTTGAQNGSRVEILTGVEEGDRVITAGISRLMQGTEVEVAQ